MSEKSINLGAKKQLKHPVHWLSNKYMQHSDGPIL